MTDEYGRQPNTYRSVVTRPDGITTTVTIRVPAALAATWKDVGELSELAAMGAARRGVSTIVERINALPVLKARTCNVVTVAVGSNFPTGMAIELRNKFQTDHTSEADGRPFVIEMSLTPESARLATERVGLFVKDVLHPAKVTLVCFHSYLHFLTRFW